MDLLGCIHWDDKNAIVEKFEPESILEIIQSFNGLPIYGWDFINCSDKDFDTWKDRLSFDYSTGDNIGLTNTIDLFQEDYNRHIDLRIFFDDFDILTPKYEPVDLEEFLENGKRGWDAVFSNNDKMDNYGIISATVENKQKLKTSINNLTGKQQPKNWLAKLKDKFKN